jgi:aarF domain-containing kinase
MYNVFQKNGGVYIKLGQIISSLGFLVPPEYQEVMEKACYDCPKSSFTDVRDVVEKELKLKLSDAFECTHNNRV